MVRRRRASSAWAIRLSSSSSLRASSSTNAANSSTCTATICSRSMPATGTVSPSASRTSISASRQGSATAGDVGRPRDRPADLGERAVRLEPRGDRQPEGDARTPAALAWSRRPSAGVLVAAARRYGTGRERAVLGRWRSSAAHRIPAAIRCSACSTSAASSTAAGSADGRQPARRVTRFAAVDRIRPARPVGRGARCCHRGAGQVADDQDHQGEGCGRRRCHPPRPARRSPRGSVPQPPGPPRRRTAATATPAGHGRTG